MVPQRFPVAGIFIAFLVACVGVAEASEAARGLNALMIARVVPIARHKCMFQDLPPINGNPDMTFKNIIKYGTKVARKVGVDKTFNPEPIDIEYWADWLCKTKPAVMGDKTKIKMGAGQWQADMEWQNANPELCAQARSGQEQTAAFGYHGFNAANPTQQAAGSQVNPLFQTSATAAQAGAASANYAPAFNPVQVPAAVPQPVQPQPAVLLQPVASMPQPQYAGGIQPQFAGAMPVAQPQAVEQPYGYQGEGAFNIDQSCPGCFVTNIGGFLLGFGAGAATLYFFYDKLVAVANEKPKGTFSKV